MSEIYKGPVPKCDQQEACGMEASVKVRTKKTIASLACEACGYCFKVIKGDTYDKRTPRLKGQRSKDHFKTEATKAEIPRGLDIGAAAACTRALAYDPEFIATLHTQALVDTSLQEAQTSYSVTVIE